MRRDNTLADGLSRRRVLSEVPLGPAPVAKGRRDRSGAKAAPAAGGGCRGRGRGRGRWWRRRRRWRRRNRPNCERILCQSRNRVGLVADLDCSFTFPAYREMERLVDCAPPVQSVVEFVFANLLYGLWRRRISARGKSAVHLAEAEYSYVVVKVLVDVGTDANSCHSPWTMMSTVEGSGSSHGIASGLGGDAVGTPTARYLFMARRQLAVASCGEKVRWQSMAWTETGRGSRRQPALPLLQG